MLKTVFSFNEHDEAWLEQLLVELLYSTLALLLYGSFLSLNDLCLFKLVAALSERALFSSDPLVLFSSRLLLFNSGKFSSFISFFISSFLHRLDSPPPRHASSSPYRHRSGVLTCIFFIGCCIVVIFLRFSCYRWVWGRGPCRCRLTRPPRTAWACRTWIRCHICGAASIRDRSPRTTPWPIDLSDLFCYLSPNNVSL